MDVSFSVSPRSLNVGEDVYVRVENYESHRGHGFTAAIGYMSGSSFVTLAWAENDGTIVYDDYIDIQVSTNYLGSEISGRSGSFYVTVWRDDESHTGTPHGRLVITVYKPASKPSVGSITLAPVQPEGIAEDFADYYIAGVTGVRVRASVSLDSEATGTSAVRLSWPGGAGVTRSYTGTSFTVELETPPINDNTTFTLTVTDSMGGSGSASKALNTVLPYVPPSMEIQELGRCDAQGTLQEGGAYYRINAIARVYTELEGNAVTKFTACLNGQSTPDNLTSGVTGILGGSMDAVTAYTVTVTIQDRVTGEQRRAFRLAGLLRDFVLKRYGNSSNLGIGCTPTRQSGSSIQLPAGGSILIGGQDVIAALEARISALENGG